MTEVQDFLEAVPLGSSLGATRYNTDDQLVLSLWTGGQTWDLRAPRRTFPGIPYPDDVEEGQAPFPHCDELVLHAPGECEFCDHYPERQRRRERDGVNFTGHHEPGKRTCPAELRRPLSTLEAWGGNVAAQGTTLRHHAPAEELRPRAWWLYGERAEPAHTGQRGWLWRLIRRVTR